MPVPPAHAGHWLAEVAYVAPVLIIVGWISVRAILDRRRADREETDAPAPPAPPAA